MQFIQQSFIALYKPFYIIPRHYLQKHNDDNAKKEKPQNQVSEIKSSHHRSNNLRKYEFQLSA